MIANGNWLETKLPKEELCDVRVIAFEGNAHLVPIFADVGTSISMRAFLKSLGLGSQPALRERFHVLSNEITNNLSEKMPLQNFSAIVPVLIDNIPFRTIWDPADNTTAEETALRFVQSTLPNANNFAQNQIVRILASQLSIRARKHTTQMDTFRSKGGSVTISNVRIQQINKLSSTKENIQEKIPSASVLAGLVMLQKYIPTVVINLWHSFGRREFMLHQFSKLPNATKLNIHWFSAVDGVYLPASVILQSVAENVVLSQGEIGIFLSHLTVWQDLLQAGLPFALILEDDCHLHSDLVSALRNGLDTLFRTLGSDWDLVALDLGFVHSSSDVRAKFGADETRAFGMADTCLDAALQAQHLIVRLDQGCSHVSIGGYIISHRGARRLVDMALPLSTPVDIFMLRAVQNASLDTYGLVPGVAHVESYGTSESVRRYMRVQNGDIFVTYSKDQDDEQLSCYNMLCQIQIST